MMKNNSHKIVLLQGFQYYDIQGTGVCTPDLFLKVLKNKFSFNMFSDKEILARFDKLAQLFGQSSQFSYKDFGDWLYNIKKPEPVVANGRPESSVRTSKSPVKSQVEEASNIQSIVETLLKNGRSRGLEVFVKVYYNSLKEALEDKNFLAAVLEKSNINLTQK